LSIDRTSGQAPLAKLALVIGVQVQVTPNMLIFLKDPASSITVDVTGRDLATTPYRLLVHDGLSAGAPISAAVFGYAQGAAAPSAFAGLASISFVDGETLLVHLPLGPTTGAALGATGCVTWTESGQSHTIASPTDQDCDGVPVPADCNDHDPNVRPGIDEVCGNGIDDNCNGQIDESPDADGDGWHLCDGDCNDHDPTVHPGAPEICDGKDNNCDGRCDEGFDADGDGYTTCGTKILAGGKCQTGLPPDCNDGDPAIHPGADEICDGKDNDCDGTCDEGFDADGDGFTTCGTIAGLTANAKGICGAPSPALIDCMDGNADVHPFAHERCDGILDACGGARETAEPCFRTPQGQCLVGMRGCDDTGAGALAATCLASTDPDLDGLVVDLALCAAYTGPCAAEVEPWRCATALAAQATFDCTLAWRRVAGTATRPPAAVLCGPAATPAPTLGISSGCQLVLVGGVAQEGYQVGFVPGGTSAAPAPAMSGCDGDLVVTAATNGFAPQPDEWVVLVDGAGHGRADAALLVVQPDEVATCPPSPLSCKMR
jgi:hypothetical protein